jgi:hypothetical protein
VSGEDQEQWHLFAETTILTYGDLIPVSWLCIIGLLSNNLHSPVHLYPGLYRTKEFLMKHNHSALFYCCVAVLAGFMTLSPLSTLDAQKRVSDKDVEALMKNLKEDSKSFRENFDAALKKSAIRRTSQEKDVKGLVANFEKQTDSMLSDFKKTKRGDVAVETTINSAQEVERLIYNLQLDSRTLSEWRKIRAELDRVSSAFGINVPYGHM